MTFKTPWYELNLICSTPHEVNVVLTHIYFILLNYLFYFYFSDAVTMSDSRKSFILATTGNYFGLSVSDGALSGSDTNVAVGDFLDDGNVGVLAGKYDGKRVSFTNKVFQSYFRLVHGVLLPEFSNRGRRLRLVGRIPLDDPTFCQSHKLSNAIKIKQTIKAQ